MGKEPSCHGFKQHIAMVFLSFLNIILFKKLSRNY